MNGIYRPDQSTERRCENCKGIGYTVKDGVKIACECKSPKRGYVIK